MRSESETPQSDNPFSIPVAERLSAAACEKPVNVTSCEPTLQRAWTGPSFFEELAEATGMLRPQVEEALSELVALGLVTSDINGNASHSIFGATGVTEARGVLSTPDAACTFGKRAWEGRLCGSPSSAPATSA